LHVAAKAADVLSAVSVNLRVYSANFKEYHKYVRGYEEAVSGLQRLYGNKKFAKAMEEVNRKIGCELSILLEVPTTRLMTYLAYLQALGSKVDSSSPAEKEIHDTLDQVQDVADTLKQAEISGQIFVIQNDLFRGSVDLEDPHRQIMCQGPMVVHEPRLLSAKKNVYAVCFNDCIVFALAGKLYRCFTLRGLDASDTSSLDLQRFELRSVHKSLVCILPRGEKVFVWLRSIEIGQRFMKEKSSLAISDVDLEAMLLRKGMKHALIDGLKDEDAMKKKKKKARKAMDMMRDGQASFALSASVASVNLSSYFHHPGASSPSFSYAGDESSSAQVFERSSDHSSDKKEQQDLAASEHTGYGNPYPSSAFPVGYVSPPGTTADSGYPSPFGTGFPVAYPSPSGYPSPGGEAYPAFPVAYPFYISGYGPGGPVYASGYSTGFEGADTSPAPSSAYPGGYGAADPGYASYPVYGYSHPSGFPTPGYESPYGTGYGSESPTPGAYPPTRY